MTFDGTVTVLGFDNETDVTLAGPIFMTNRTIGFECNVADIIIPDTVTSIGDTAFSGCTGLSRIRIPSSVTSIGSYAFSSCSGLTSVDIPDSVTVIWGSAFEMCTSLTSVTIGSGIAGIGQAAFMNCRYLTRITCRAATPPTMTSDAFVYVPTNIPVYVPSGSISTYENDVYWGNFRDYREISE